MRPSALSYSYSERPAVGWQQTVLPYMNRVPFPARNARPGSLLWRLHPQLPTFLAAELLLATVKIHLNPSHLAALRVLTTRRDRAPPHFFGPMCLYYLEEPGVPVGPMGGMLQMVKGV